MAHFLHTADLHLGRAFRSIGGELATKLAEARYQAVETLARLADERGVGFVVVAGDLFDTAQPSGKVLAQALQAIGKIKVPVYAIPGNHDPGGPLGPYERDAFRRYRDDYAPNLHILHEAVPLVLDESRVVLLPCPIVGRPADDPTAWLRDRSVVEVLPEGYTRVVVAHGGTVDFSSDLAAAPELQLDRLTHAAEEIDYIALGDWHGSMPYGRDNVRYAGTPEPDKFPLHDRYLSGVALEVQVTRGVPAAITTHATGRFAWSTRAYTLRDADDLARLDRELLGATDASGRLLRCTLDGSLDIANAAALEAIERRLADVYERAEVDKRALLIAPGADELAALTQDVRHPTIASVATRLHALVDDPDRGGAARLALVRLYEAVTVAPD